MTNEKLAAQLNQRFDALENRMDERFSGVDGRFATIDGRFGTIDAQFKNIEEQVHQNGVLIEDVRDKVNFAIDDVRRVEGKLDRFVTETGKNFANLDARVTILHAGRSRRPS